jgi:NADPH:quinone reductase
VLDGVGGDVARRAFELLEGGGRILSFGLASGTWVDIPADAARERGVTVMRQQRATPDELRAMTERALAEAAQGACVR